MDLFFLLTGLVALSTFTLTRLRPEWMSGGLRRSRVVIAGLAAWVLVLSCGLWAFETMRLMILAVRGSSAALVTACSGVLLGGLALKIATVIEPGPLKDFVVDSVLFRTGRRRTEGYGEEEAQRKLDEHHRAMGELTNASRLLGRSRKQHSAPEQLRAELENTRGIIRSPDLSRELELLKVGTPIDLTDSWRIFWLSRGLEEPADQIMTLALDPQTAELTVHLVRDDLESGRRPTTLSSHRLRQDLYDLMMRIWTSEWISPYAAFVRSLAVVVYGTSVDTFGVARAQPVAKSSLPIGHFQKSERGVRNVRDLPLDILGPDPV